MKTRTGKNAGQLTRRGQAMRQDLAAREGALHPGDVLTAMRITKPADVLARNVVEASLNAGPAIGRGWVLIEQYQGQEGMYVTIAGDQIEEPGTGGVHTANGVTWETTSLGALEEYGRALIDAAMKARELGFDRR